MIIKIFYFVIAIFSVVMVFLVSFDPYISEVLKEDLSVSNIQILKVTDYEMNASVISGIYVASEANRYKDRDEFLNFKAQILRAKQEHNLSADRAILMGDIIKFSKNARYENNESLSFVSDEIEYDTKRKIAVSNVPFVIMQNSDKTTGQSGSYDLNKKQTRIKGLKGWIEQQR